MSIFGWRGKNKDTDTEGATAAVDASDRQPGTSSTMPAPGHALPAADDNTHTVVAGDSLWRIAERRLGDGRKWEAIYNANRKVIKDPDILPPGLILKMPKKA